PVFLYDLERTTAYFENALNDIDFYSKGRMMIPKYIFVRLDMEKRANEVLDYSDKIMIEHVLPRNAKEAYWKDNFSADQRRNWANKFGNLVIITGAKNTRANNKPFAEKVEQYLSKKSDFAITKEVLELSDWNMDSLKDRHESLVNRALELWTKF
ncbi:MAG: HNH endonuclease family protein, partial [Clostridium perfringens]